MSEAKRLKVWESRINEPKEEPQRYVRAIPISGNDIAFAIVGEDGETVNMGRFLFMNPRTGAIRRGVRVNPILGFELDEQGRVKLEYE